VSHRFLYITGITKLTNHDYDLYNVKVEGSHRAKHSHLIVLRPHIVLSIGTAALVLKWCRWQVYALLEDAEAVHAQLAAPTPWC